MTSERGTYRISVVIPAYNTGRHLARAIDSVLAQTRQADEIIVVDDGSTDDTAEIARAYGGRVRLIQQANAGASAARNAGIEAATGEWVAFLDADDEWLPDKLMLQTQVLKRNGHLAWATGNYLGCVCLTERRLPHVPVEKARALTRGQNCIDSFFRAIMDDLWGCTDTMLVRRQVLIEAGLFTPELTWGEDFDLWWRIAYRHPEIGYVAEPLAVYHLDVEDSALHQRRDAAVWRHLIERHLALAREHGRLDAFRPCAVFLLRRWIRALLFEARGREVRQMLRQFGPLLPRWYTPFMRVFAAFPRTTAAGCRSISWFARTFGLRKRPVRSRRASD